MTSHFKGKDAIGHVAETQAQGIITSSEIHGREAPGSISAGTDAARETSILLVFLSFIAYFLHWNSETASWIFTGVLAGWLVWKIGRSAQLGWARLERMHRILEEERWEIEHNRSQEREELRVLYAAKGFEGKLLEDVVDVLMADGDRLLKVMIEEELNLSLESHEHPLKQGLGAATGVITSVISAFILYSIFPVYGIAMSALIIVGCAAAIAAYFERNNAVHAVVWNIGLTILSAGSAYFLLDYLRHG